MNIKTAGAFVRVLKQPYAWPGGYPLYFIMDDCEALCFECARKEKSRICTAISEKERCGWTVKHVDVNWESTDLYCCHCSKPIESAYGETQQTKGENTQ